LEDVVVVESVLLVAQQGAGPVGSEFGKASPIGWFVIVALLAAVLFLGWAFHRRYSRMNRRRGFAANPRVAPLPVGKKRAAMAEAGVLDQRKLGWF